VLYEHVSTGAFTERGKKLGREKDVQGYKGTANNKRKEPIPEWYVLGVCHIRVF
jgi:hypothetical protein